MRDPVKMWRSVRGLVASLRGFLRAEKKWTPRPARIVLPHRENVPVIEPLFGGEPYEVVDLYGESVYLDPRILFATLRHVMQMGQVRWVYVRAGYFVAILERIKPALVVTFIDSTAFQIAAKQYRQARFLVIQDGGRLLDRDYPKERSPRIYLREFACLGRFEIDQYKAHGAQVETFYPVGSLRDSYYRARRPQGFGAGKEFDLCVPSQFKPSAQFVYSERLDSFAVLAGHVRRFCETHGTTVCVPLRRHPDTNAAGYEWETQYLRGLLGDAVQFFPNVPGAYTTYGLTDRSRVTIGMHTTVLREAFGRGNRILSCNYTGNPVYTFPLAGPWTLTDPSYEVFEQRLLWLLAASDEEYRNAVADLPAYLISYDETTPTHVFLQRLIADAVRGAPEPAGDMRAVPAGELTTL